MSFLPGHFPAASAGAFGAFPVVQATNVTNTDTSANLPASIQSGDLLLLFIADCVGSDPGAISGWTQFFHEGTSGTAGLLTGYYRVANGSEGATLTIPVQAASLTYRISGYQGTPESADTSSTSAGSPDPPSLAPSWGSAKTLWIAVGLITSTSAAGPRTISGFPSNYTGGITAEQNLPFNDVCTVGGAQRNLEASSDDPGAFTVSATDGWAAAIVAIRPA